MRNSWPTSTSTCSIGVPERRSSQYSFTNSAESCVPASICMACESLEGAGTFSEEWVVGLYQYICVLLSKGRCLRCTRCYERQNACGLLDKVAWVRGGLITFNTNLSRFSARSHTALLVILVIRIQLATEGSNVDAGTE